MGHRRLEDRGQMLPNIPQWRTFWPQIAVVPRWKGPCPYDTASYFSVFPSVAPHSSSAAFHLLHTTDGVLPPPLTPRPLSQMAEGSAATKHLMTCDKCGQTAGPAWAPLRPLIGQGGLINNSTVTARVLLSGRDGARPPAPGAGLYGTGLQQEGL